MERTWCWTHLTLCPHDNRCHCHARVILSDLPSLEGSQYFSWGVGDGGGGGGGGKSAGEGGAAAERRNERVFPTPPLHPSVRGG